MTSWCPAYRWHDPIKGEITERGNSSRNAKGKIQVTENTRTNTDVLDGDGESRSSEDGPVMGPERRGFITWSKTPSNYL